MALRQHRLPQFWLGLTLGLVLVATGGVYWWERQLPRRLEEAAARGDLEACLRYSEQLEALRWLGGPAPLEQGSCRRRQAQRLWDEQRWAAALQEQLQLVNSPAGQPADEQRLQRWQQELQDRALVRYREGDLDGALAVLAAMGEDRRADGSSLGDRLRQAWTRNRLQAERARQLIDQQRWWEALEALTRIDHPWWKRRSQPLEAQIRRGIAGLKVEEREHAAHGSLPHGVPADQLDRLVQQKMAAGMGDWEAFTAACQALGGRVVEAGPESACQR